MAVDLSPIDESLLASIANIHGMPKGAFNIRRDGELVERHSTAYIEIETLSDNPGINVSVKSACEAGTVQTAAENRGFSSMSNVGTGFTSTLPPTSSGAKLRSVQRPNVFTSPVASGSTSTPAPSANAIRRVE